VLAGLAALLLTRFYGHREPIAPVVVLEAPHVVEADETTRLHARVAGEHLPPARVSWTSSLDGALGEGATLERRLSPGVHEIEVRVEDGEGRTATDQARIEVRAEPGT